MKCIVVICVLLAIPGCRPTNTESDDAPCVLDPELVGQWLTSVWGHVTVTNTTITLSVGDLGVAQNVEVNSLSCHVAGDNDTYYILKTEEFQLFQTSFAFYTCVSFHKINSDHFRIKIKSERNDAENIPGVVRNTNAFVPDQSLCEDTAVLTGDLVREGKWNNLQAGVPCPALLTGQFNVTYTGNANLTCPSGATLTSCDDPNSVTLSNENCAGDISDLLTESETQICLSGDEFNTTVLINGTNDVTAYAFSCVRLSLPDASDNSTVTLLTSSKSCQGVWKPTEDDEDEEFSFTLNFSAPCPEEEDEVEEPATNTTSSGNSTTPGNSTVSPFDFGNTTDTDDNSTSSDDNSTNSGDGMGDAATSLMSNGFLLPAVLTCLAVVFANHMH